MSLQKDIAELLQAGVISPEVAERLSDYYRQKEQSSSSRLFSVFGVLGALLVGLGIILIIAHNWDELSRGTKTFFCFLPLLLGQLAAGYTLLKKRASTPWRESSATFLFLAIGASISLVSQVYHIPGNLSSFLLTWVLLGLPLVYLLRSSVVSLLYLLGITWYSCELSYWAYPYVEAYVYWPLLLAILPHYYRLYKSQPGSNFAIFHHWFVPLSLLVCLATLAEQEGALLFVAYMSLLGGFILLGRKGSFQQQKLRNNGYLVLGSLGTVGLLLALSFRWFWEELQQESFSFPEVLVAPEFLAAVLFTAGAASLAYRQWKRESLQELQPLEPVFLFFIPLFLLGLATSFTVILINLLVLALGVFTIQKGARQDHLGILNWGLLIITALVVCRFFDTDLSFVLRGIMFVLVGVGFFATNYWMLKKRKSYAH